MGLLMALIYFIGLILVYAWLVLPAIDKYGVWMTVLGALAIVGLEVLFKRAVED